ncbi:GNAT family N-acetyltransferase [Pseudobowmanella zhangzhouensis]
MTIHYEFLQPEHFARFVELANRVHGDNYIDLATLETYAQRSVKNHINASIVALDEERMVGFRLTFAAGQWPFDKWCSVDKWPVAADDMCYFKVIAVDPEYQGSGVGGELLKRSIEQAKQQGAKA